MAEKKAGASTQEEWEVSAHMRKGTDTYFDVYDTNDEIVCTVEGRVHDEMLRRATLIAASPDMLRTLELLAAKLQALCDDKFTPVVISTAIYKVLVESDIKEVLTKATK